MHVDKHESDYNFTQFLSKFRFPNNSVSCQYFFTKISHANRCTIYMKHIKQEFSLKTWVRPPGWTKRWGRGQNTTFSEYGHVAYRIKGNDTYINIAKVFAKTPPPTQGWGQKDNVQLFQSTVMLHIKLKGMTKAITCKHTFCPYTHLRSQGWDQRSNHFFLKVVMLHIKLIGMEQRTPCKNTSSASMVGSKDQQIIFSESTVSCCISN